MQKKDEKSKEGEEFDPDSMSQQQGTETSGSKRNDRHSPQNSPRADRKNPAPEGQSQSPNPEGQSGQKTRRETTEELVAKLDGRDVEADNKRKQTQVEGEKNKKMKTHDGKPLSVGIQPSAPPKVEVIEELEAEKELVIPDAPEAPPVDYSLRKMILKKNIEEGKKSPKSFPGKMELSWDNDHNTFTVYKVVGNENSPIPNTPVKKTAMYTAEITPNGVIYESQHEKGLESIIETVRASTNGGKNPMTIEVTGTPEQRFQSLDQLINGGDFKGIQVTQDSWKGLDTKYPQQVAALKEKYTKGSNANYQAEPEPEPDPDQSQSYSSRGP